MTADAPMTAARLDELATHVEDMNKIGPWGFETEEILDAMPQLIALARDGLRWWTIMDEIKAHGKDHPEYMQAWELVIAWRGAIRTDAVPDADGGSAEGKSE